MKITHHISCRGTGPQQWGWFSQISKHTYSHTAQVCVLLLQGDYRGSSGLDMQRFMFTTLIPISSLVVRDGGIKYMENMQ